MIQSSLILNAHSVTTLRCKSYSGCFVLSFLKVQCPFYLWLIRTTVLQHYLALISTRIFIITANPSGWLLVSPALLYYQIRLVDGVSMHKPVAWSLWSTRSKLMLTPKTNNSWVYILIPQPMTACECCLNLLCICSFDVSRMFAARYDVVQWPNENTSKIFFIPVAM